MSFRIPVHLPKETGRSRAHRGSSRAAGSRARTSGSPAPAQERLLWRHRIPRRRARTLVAGLNGLGHEGSCLFQVVRAYGLWGRSARGLPRVRTPLIQRARGRSRAEFRGSTHVAGPNRRSSARVRRGARVTATRGASARKRPMRPCASRRGRRSAAGRGLPSPRRTRAPAAGCTPTAGRTSWPGPVEHAEYGVTPSAPEPATHCEFEQVAGAVGIHQRVPEPLLAAAPVDQQVLDRGRIP